MEKVFVTKRIVQQSEIDELNHVNNIVYLQWVQDVAKLHWQELTKNSAVNDIWVVLRHEIDYLRSAVLGDEITIKTWVGETEGVKSIRYVEILKGENVLAKATTTWCLLDGKTFRPKRIDEHILKVLLPHK